MRQNRSARPVYLALIFFGATFASYTASGQGNFVWVNTHGGIGFDGAFGLALDTLDNVVITGRFGFIVDFGDGNVTAAGSDDVFISKYDSNGNRLWTKTFGTSTSEVALGAAVDATGNIVIAGTFRGSTDLGSGGHASAGEEDVFVAKYDSNGNPMWSKSFGGTLSDVPSDITIDSLGNVLVTGEFQDTVDFGGGAFTSAGFNDIFVVKYDTNGNHLWSKVFGSASGEESNGIATDMLGNVVITGSFSNSVDFGGGGLTSAGTSDFFVAKYDSNGNHLWSKSAGDSSGQIAETVAMDAAGNVIIGGRFAGTIDFGGGGLISAGSTDVFVVKYDSNGNHIWSKAFGDSLLDGVAHVATDASGNILLTGNFLGSIDFGGGAIVNVVSPTFYLVKFDGNGNHLWSKGVGAGTFRVAADGSGDVVVSGLFQNTVDFGGGALTAAGLSDIFVAKYTGAAAPSLPLAEPLVLGLLMILAVAFQMRSAGQRTKKSSDQKVEERNG